MCMCSQTLPREFHASFILNTWRTGVHPWKWQPFWCTASIDFAKPLSWYDIICEHSIGKFLVWTYWSVVYFVLMHTYTARGHVITHGVHNLDLLKLTFIVLYLHSEGFLIPSSVAYQLIKSQWPSQVYWLHTTIHPQLIRLNQPTYAQDSTGKSWKLYFGKEGTSNQKEEVFASS